MGGKTIIDPFYHSPALIVFIPLVSSLIIASVGFISKKLQHILFFIALLITAFFGILMSYEIYTVGDWSFAIELGSMRLTSGDHVFMMYFLADGVSAMATIILSITSVAAGLYSYTNLMEEEDSITRYYILFLITVAGTHGMIFSANLFNRFLWFQVVIASTSALVAFRKYDDRAFEAALKYLVLGCIAWFFFLFSIGIAYGVHGEMQFYELAEGITGGFADRIAMAILIVVMAFKSGAVPVHFVKPDAYSRAPSSVTVVMVVVSQAGLWTMFRIVFNVYGTAVNTYIVGWVVIMLGILSAFIGVSMALVQRSIKRLMAYHAISQTGYMLLGVGVGIAVMGTTDMGIFGRDAMVGGIFHIINHAIYKGLLFLTAGAIIYKTGERDLNKMGGLGRSMKWTMLFFIIGALAISGVPPLNGFTSKLIIYRSVYMFNPVLSVVAMLVSILTLASFYKVFHSVFMGASREKYNDIKEEPMTMLVGMGILAFAVILLSIFPGRAIAILVEPAVEALGVIS